MQYIEWEKIIISYRLKDKRTEYTVNQETK